jgi:hypothetical protein
MPIHRQESNGTRGQVERDGTELCIIAILHRYPQHSVSQKTRIGRPSSKSALQNRTQPAQIIGLPNPL